MPLQSQTRRATLDDVPALARIHRLALQGALPHFPVLHTPEEDRTYYATVVFPRAEIWLAETSDVIAGFIATRPGWIDQLHVDPACQRRGIGTQLLLDTQARHPSLQLWTFQCNHTARRFYENHGFHVERLTDGRENEERQPDVLYRWNQATCHPNRAPS
jgi:ribosomal protein S18 acetylase RimI-like enzyme